MKYLKILFFFLLLFVMSCCSSKSERSKKMIIKKDSVTLVNEEPDVIHEGSRESSIRTETADMSIETPTIISQPEMVTLPSPSHTPPTPISMTSGVAAAGEPQPLTDDNLTYGDITYNEIDTMVVGRTDVVELTVSYNIPISEVVDAVESFASTEEVKTESIRIAPKMLVTLIDPTDGQNFTITKISPEEQIIEINDITKWNWNVTPLNKGDNKLVLSVNIVLESGTKNIKVYEDYIYVYSTETFFEKIWTFFINSWQWFLSAIIIPLSLYSYNIFFRKKKVKE